MTVSPPTSLRSPRRFPPAIAWVLAAHAALALAFLVATPLGEAPDEPSHVQYVMYLREERGLPVVPADGAARLPQGKHPPLYYVLGEIISVGGDFESLGFILNPHFSFRVPDDSAIPAFIHPPGVSFPDTPGEVTGRRLRLVSLFAGLLTVYATWRLGLVVWPRAPEIALAAAATVAFMPGFAFMAAVFNNDALAAAWSAVVIWLAAGIAIGRDREGLDDADRSAERLGGRLVDRATDLDVNVPGYRQVERSTVHATDRSLERGADRQRAIRAFRPHPYLLSIGLGIGLGLALITKLTTLPIFAVAGVALLVRARHEGWRWLLHNAALAGGALIVVGGWWPARNVALYGLGDPLGLRRWSGSIPHLDRLVPFRSEIGTYLRVQFTSFWGRFGWVNVPMPSGVYAALALVCALAACGLAVLVIRRRTLERNARMGLAICALAAVLAYVAALRLGVTLNLVAAHGRYLYVALAPIAILFVSGLVGWMPAGPRRAACKALAFGMLGLGIFSFTGVLLPAYDAPTALAEAEVDALSRDRIDVDFGGRLRLVALGLRAVEGVGGDTRSTESGASGGGDAQSSESHAFEGVDDRSPISSASDGLAPRIPRGAILTVEPVWTALRPLWRLPDDEPDAGPDPPGSRMFAHVVDSDGEVVGRVNAHFDGRHPPEAWRPGDAHAAHIEIPISADAATGRATLIIGLESLDSPGERLLAATSDGESIGDAYRMERLVIVAPDEAAPPVPEHPRGDILDGPFGHDGAPVAVELVGFDLLTHGTEIELTLHWRAGTMLGTDLQVLVHVADSTGRPLVQADGPPAEGRLPTSLWTPGEIVLDRRRIDVGRVGDAALAARVDQITPESPVDDIASAARVDDIGPVRILVGLYDLARGERLRATGSDGRVWPDGAIDLGVDLEGALGLEATP